MCFASITTSSSPLLSISTGVCWTMWSWRERTVIWKRSKLLLKLSATVLRKSSTRRRLRSRTHPCPKGLKKLLWKRWELCALKSWSTSFSQVRWTLRRGRKGFKKCLAWISTTAPSLLSSVSRLTMWGTRTFSTESRYTLTLKSLVWKHRWIC